MINHARTLLINPTAEQRQAMQSRPLSHYVPSAYTWIPDSTAAQEVHRLLFGRDPDGWTLNYLGHTYMSILDHPVYREAVLGFDPRITHDQEHPVLGLPRIRRIGEDPLAVISGRYPGDPEMGHNELRGLITYAIDGSDIRYDYSFERPKISGETNIVVPPGESLPIGETGLYVRLDTSSNGEMHVEVMVRPTRTPVEALAMIDERPGLVDALDDHEFTRAYAEWYRHGDLDLDRLAGVLLTLIAHREARRG